MNSDAFDDAQVTLRAIAQSGECRLVAGAVMGGYRLCKIVELDQHGALIDAGFISLGRVAAREEAPASGEDSRNRKLGQFFPCPGIGDRTVADNPICLGHGLLSFVDLALRRQSLL